MLKLKSLPVLLFVAAGALSASAQDAQTLYQDFQHPGQPYRPPCMVALDERKHHQGRYLQGPHLDEV